MATAHLRRLLANHPMLYRKEMGTDMVIRSRASRVEVIVLNSKALELRLYVPEKGKEYHHWKMPWSVATLIAHWWKYREDHSEKEKRFTNLVISMPSSGLVDVYELDTFGHIKPSGWSLPVIVVEALAKELP